MPEIAPFCGLRYNLDRFTGQLSSLIAPPYDVLDAEDKAALLSRHDRNIVAVDLPFVPPKSPGPDEVYAQAAATLRAWRQDGSLVQDAQPAIYVYHQEFTCQNRTYIRRMFFARMRLEPFGSGTIFPHENTFGGPKEDRRKLMEATACQLSPIFGLYSDPEQTISGLLDVGDRPADMAAAMQDVINKLWIVTDPQTVERVRETMALRPVFIADGHHRYSTALMYRDALITREGQLPSDHPARFVFSGFCAMEDPGCLILPTHRVISEFGDIKPAEVLAAIQKGVRTQAAGSSITNPHHLLPTDSPDDLGIYVAAGDRMYTGRFTHRQVLDELAGQHCAAWRQLDLAYLHLYLLDQLVTQETLGGKAPAIAYIKDAADAVRTARQCNGIALLTKPCTMAQLRAVSEAGDLMPQKSTYFYPKLATGLVLYPLE